MLVPILRTERLLLRPWHMDDAADMFAYARDPEVGPNAGWKAHESVEESEKILRLWTAPENPDMIWAVTEKGKGRVIGSIGLHPDESRAGVPDVKTLGYVLARPYWGRGYMTEGAGAVRDHAFEKLGLRLLAVAHFPFNARSKRVIEKLGFSYEGTMRAYAVLPDGTVTDECLYSMTREEFEELR